MKRTVIVIALAVLAAASLSCSRKQEQAPARTDPVTPAERLGYAIGMEVGDSLRSIGAELDVAAFVQGVQDTFSGAEPALTPQQATEVKTAFMQKRQAEIERSMKELADRNLAEGKAFLEENKTREGVVATTSGLQYAVLQDGEGPQPGPDDRIKVHFTASLLDGSLFQDTHAEGQPLTLLLGGLLPGLKEGIGLMRAGSKYRFFLPPELAYGERSPGPSVGPNSTLVFEVELLAVNPPEEAPPPEGQQPPAPEEPEGTGAGQPPDKGTPEPGAEPGEPPQPEPPPEGGGQPPAP